MVGRYGEDHLPEGPGVVEHPGIAFAPQRLDAAARMHGATALPDKARRR
jgi:hypothetical protein